MSTAALAFINLADSPGVVTASGANTLTPATNLQNEHVSVKWRLNGTSAYIIVDLGSSQVIDTIALMGVSGTAPTFRVRMSLTDATVTGSLVSGSDTGSITGVPYFDPDFRKFIYLYAVTKTTRYVRIDISEAAVAYIEAGRIFVGLRIAFGINFQTPHTHTPVRKSIYTRGTGGATFIDRRKGTWRDSASFGFLSDTERKGFIRAMGVRVVNYGHLDYLWIPDPDSDNLAADCIWGFQVPDEQPVTQNLYVVPPVYTVEFQVEDRG